jgi:transposase-like protein
MRENRITITWDPAAPTTIERQEALQLYLPLASLRGIRVIFAVTPARADAITANPSAPAQYAAFLAHLARTFPAVKDYVVGNEPNQPRFWRPQFRRGAVVSPTAYYSLLARSYDALKAVNPSITVIGVGLSPRGNDQPNAGDNVSVSPVRFISRLGKAYRSARRRAPIMDELAFHPYPDRDTDSLMKGYRWPNAGVPNLDRIKQAFWDAFRGTRQPTFGEGRSRGRVAFRLDELGWQVGIPPASAGAYFGFESVRPTNEANQSGIYAQAIRYLACDASVRSVLFFLLRDEPDLERWQAGLIRADGSPRSSFDSVRAEIARSNGRCSGQFRSWRHTTTVTGGRLRFPKARVLPARRQTLALVANAEEDATAEAAVYRGKRRIARTRTTVKAYRSRVIRVSARFRPGRYTVRVTLGAALNPARKSSFAAPLRITR